MPTHGEGIIDRCKQHVMETLCTLPEPATPAPDGNCAFVGPDKMCGSCSDAIGTV